MRTASKLVPRASDEPTPFHLRATISVLVAEAWRSFLRELYTVRGERYKMRHEDLLRGPLSHEARRARWL